MSKQQRRQKESSSHGASSGLWRVLLFAGLVLLLAGAVDSASFLGHLTSRGWLSFPLQARLQALRLTAAIVGSILAAVFSWRGSGRRLGLAVTAAVIACSLFLTFRLYPHHLFFQPLRLIRAALGEELLLSDYDPQPRVTLAVHRVLRAKFPVINIHAHFRRGAVRTAENMIAIMDQVNVERLVDLDGELGRRFHEEVTQYAVPHPERFAIFATVWFPPGPIDWKYFKWSVDQLEDAKRSGAKGIKMWKNLGLRTVDESRKLIAVDDMRLEPVWKKAGELKLPILIHLGDPVAFFQAVDRHNERYEELKANLDWSFYGPQYPSLETILSQFERVVSRHPEVTFILAHVANRTDSLQEAAAMLDRHPNLCMDVAARVSELGRQPEAARAFLIKYQDRLFFGTDGNPNIDVYRSSFRFFETADEYFDYPYWPRDNYGRWKIYGVHLPNEALRKLYHDNAARLLGLPLLQREGKQDQGS